MFNVIQQNIFENKPTLKHDLYISTTKVLNLLSEIT